MTRDAIEFSKAWGSPLGHRAAHRALAAKVAHRLGLISIQARAAGPFGFQPDNNATRTFEYPWAATVVPVHEGLLAVDVGGSLGGLQFVLSSLGARVVNVDPSDAAAMGWKVDAATIATLNRAFGTTVELRKAFLQDAGFADDSVDRIYCISTIEHIPPGELPALAKEMGRILRPGGFVVATVDLFYDLAPFTACERNVHGTNIDLHALIADTGLELHLGEPAELCGFAAFDPPSILARAMDFVQGDVALNTAQAFVLRKP